MTERLRSRFAWLAPCGAVSFSSWPQESPATSGLRNHERIHPTCQGGEVLDIGRDQDARQRWARARLAVGDWAAEHDTSRPGEDRPGWKKMSTRIPLEKAEELEALRRRKGDPTLAKTLREVIEAGLQHAR